MSKIVRGFEELHRLSMAADAARETPPAFGHQNMSAGSSETGADTRMGDGTAGAQNASMPRPSPTPPPHAHGRVKTQNVGSGPVAGQRGARGRARCYDALITPARETITDMPASDTDTDNAPGAMK